MDIDGFDPRHDAKDSRTLDRKADDSRAFGLAMEGDDDADQAGVEADSTKRFDRLDPQASQQVTSIADLAVLMEEQFAALAADLDRKHRSFSRAMASELDTLRKDMNRPAAAEGWDNGIREHMRVIQGQTARIHHENVAKIEAVKEISATELHAAGEAVAFAARNVTEMTSRAVFVCIGTIAGLFLLVALLLIW
ncbi:MAG: hypothetical protein H9533_04150 [Rhodobacteraceae bacterium]|jgi:hypothetical protein|nr:hypothetical protein [Paracoccaceae bacterium]